MSGRIGYIRERYPETRNIIGRASGGREYVRIGKAHDLRLSLERGCQIVGGRLLRRSLPIKWNHHAVFNPVVRPRVDVIHTFNALCDTRVPWVCTFETAVPRTEQTVRRDWFSGSVKADRFTRRAFELLTRDSCKALIALSESAKGIQLGIMEALDIAGRDAVAEKMIVLPPPQPLLITDGEMSAKFADIDECVELIFVGGEFFRKGGEQVLDALDRLRDCGRRFHLTLISSLGYGDYASRATAEDKDRCLERIKADERITYYERLPNSEVLELCKRAHIGLLPTLADTYGYSVLEMQSCGCAMMTTDVRALPEMNNEGCGYVIPVPKHPSGEARFDADADLALLKETIGRGVYDALRTIAEQPRAAEAKAKAAAARISAEHSPERYADRLSAIYDRAIK